MIRVLVATPLGRGGNGGIDRLMDLVRDELACCPPEGMEVRFEQTRGSGSIVLSPFVLTRFLAVMALWRPHVVHINVASHGSTSRKLCIAAAAHALGITTVIHLHGALFRDFWGQASPRLSRAIAWMFARAGRVVVLGRVWRDFVLGRVPGAKIVVFPNATRRPVLPPRLTDDETRLLFLGRLGERKGSRDLVDALARLDSTLGWRMIMAGDGEVAETRARVAAAGLSNKVEVPGWVGAEYVAKLIAEADVLILPSYNENLPMSVIEGMAAGLAVIATPVGAVEDIVADGETGLLVAPGDVPALAEAIRRLLHDPDLRAQLGSAAAALHREQLDITPYVRRLVVLWRDAAAA
ncbi:glycosyltransferase family 4 protein [Sphingomonas sp. RHCKR47]|uniref:glycosyltransferase family 4 protein n=1 Tax=Sphingomonas citricola TaxID=2862498 RepID=UPI001C67C40C|nr:glycosyltransferase family 4 protein [Sphingomonas citricola]MBW6525099.1 glycosyltransferase family 4 protein [Sphingomonas citricola]